MSKKSAIVKRLSKKDIYAMYGIEFKREKSGEYIYSPEFGWITPLLQNGNTKVGKNVWTWSTLPTNSSFTITINDRVYTEFGTCACHCVGCYATKGNYNYSTTIQALFVRTWLARHALEFVKNAIQAQIAADHIALLRIHAAGDFFSDDYANMWAGIVEKNPNVLFWTYTKVTEFENMFDAFANANIVKSLIPGYGFNFGLCDYILRVYKALKAAGVKVYICRCGVDDNQHCTDCHGCVDNDYVLFIEHGTGYKAEKDPAYNELKNIIECQ